MFHSGTRQVIGRSASYWHQLKLSHPQPISELLVVGRAIDRIRSYTQTRTMLNGHGVKNLNWKTTEVDFETIAIRESCDPTQFGARCIVPPIVTSAMFLMEGTEIQSTFYAEQGDQNSPKVYKKAETYEYSRLSNPTRDIAENVLAKLEGSKYALVLSSGAAAVAAVAYLLQPGDHMITTKASYHGSHQIYEERAEGGILCDFAMTTDVEDLVRLIRPNTKLIAVESLSNPTLSLVDIQELSRRVRQIQAGIIISVDNTFLTSVLHRPLDLGADIAVYSCSKYLGGHADLILGALTTNSAEIYEKLLKAQQRTGSIPSPYDSSILIRSLKTLPIRMEQHSKNALAVSRFLQNHPNVDRVVYPGLESHPQHELALAQQFNGSGMVGIYVKGGYEAAIKFLNSIKVILRAPSLGAACSLATLSSKTSHKPLAQAEKTALGITDNYIRLSVGLEGSRALIEDLDQALRAGEIPSKNGN